MSRERSEWGPEAPTWQRRRRSPASARVNIYLPPELGRRLEQARERGIDINVSRVCQDALERLLDAIEAGEG
ncbi:MAG TPA: hypothetical protein VKY26_09195 [Actinomycetota bacterium]|nr:hypothetical protein [Actinomycetota bacterium]